MVLVSCLILAVFLLLRLRLSEAVPVVTWERLRHGLGHGQVSGLQYKYNTKIEIYSSISHSFVFTFLTQ